MDFKKVLIAVDGSDNSLRAVRYAASILGGGKGYAVQLVHIERLPERDLFPDESSWSGQCREHSRDMREFLDEARAVLEAGGLSGETICSLYVDSCAARPEAGSDCSHGRNIALEILAIAEREECGTLVIGRRGVSKAEEFLFGSVSNKLIHHAKDRTVWVVS
ncbi:universal stress protein [uncultured Pseudodesulfovibrio sp.]|uniref:universal stress protein n=1 Tax=uncultured Pseudodesulfovibrio sp. TaxID=2035858 RepID=UPI0029C87D38|nr:universal stress protein [uncultured Pseudodesulfovibrio sp.]